MVASERRITPRLKLHTAFTFHRMKQLSEYEHHARAVNISTGGICFATSLAFAVGEEIEVLLEMPKQVTGAETNCRRFTGRVVHVGSEISHRGRRRIGVQLLYYELAVRHSRSAA